jgi:hypothetical protein
MENSNERDHIFVISLVDVLAPLPFEIIPGYFFDKAQLDTVRVIKYLLNIAIPYPYSPNLFLYERSIRAEPGKAKGSTVYYHDVLTAENWRYWTVWNNGMHIDSTHLEQACLLLKNEIEFGFHITHTSRGTFHSPVTPLMIKILGDIYEAAYRRPITQVKLDDLKLISENCSFLKQLKPEHEHIKNALKLFDDLRTLPSNSDVIVIRLFSIIESLISSKDKNSIKHQIRTKIPLLKKYFVRELNYREFFHNEIGEDIILSKLYDYRSAVVHSGKSQIPEELLRFLKGKKEVQAFLRELTKQLLMVSIRKPDLVTDLDS